MSKRISINLTDDDPKGVKIANFIMALCRYFNISINSFYDQYGQLNEKAAIQALEKYIHFSFFKNEKLSEVIEWINNCDSLTDLMVIDMHWEDEKNDETGGVKIIEKIKNDDYKDTIICSNTTHVELKFRAITTLANKYKINPLIVYEDMKKDCATYFLQIAQKYYLSAAEEEIKSLRSLLEKKINGYLLSDEQLLTETVVLNKELWEVRHWLLCTWCPIEYKYTNVRSTFDKLIKGVSGPKHGPWAKGLLPRYFHYKHNYPQEFTELWGRVRGTVDKFLSGEYDITNSEKLICTFFSADKSFETLSLEKLIPIFETVLIHRLIVLHEARLSKDRRIILFLKEGAENTGFKFKKGFPLEFQKKGMAAYFNTYLGFGREGYVVIERERQLEEESIVIRFENLLPEEYEWMGDFEGYKHLLVDKEFSYLCSIMKLIKAEIENNSLSFTYTPNYNFSTPILTIGNSYTNLKNLIKEQHNALIAQLFTKIVEKLDSYPSGEEERLPIEFIKIFAIIREQEGGRAID